MLRHIKNHHHFMWAYTRRLIVSLNRPVFYFLFVTALSLILICAGLFFALEADQVNPPHTYIDCVYFTVTTMTGVGFGDIVPYTGAGKILTILMMLVGTALYVSFTGVVAATVIEIERSTLQDWFNQQKPPPEN